ELLRLSRPAGRPARSLPADALHGRSGARRRPAVHDAAQTGSSLTGVRVLHVSPYFPPAFRYGGPPASVLGLCKGLQRAGVDVEVVTTTANGDAALPAAPNGTQYDGVPVRYAGASFPRRFFGARVRTPLAEALRVLALDVPMAVVPNGVDLAAADAARRGYRARLGIPADAFVVLFLGRLHRIKRLDLLADAFAAARAERPALHLVIAGP